MSFLRVSFSAIFHLLRFALEFFCKYCIGFQFRKYVGRIWSNEKSFFPFNEFSSFSAEKFSSALIKRVSFGSNVQCGRNKSWQLLGQGRGA